MKLHWLKTIDIVEVISIVSTIVGGVEVLFRRHRKAGPKKRERAIKRLKQVIAPGADWPSGAETAISVLVDILGANAHKTGAAEDIAIVYGVIQDQVEMVDALAQGDDAAIDDLVEWLNAAIDLPVLDEGMEKFILRMLVDAAIEAARK